MLKFSSLSRERRRKWRKLILSLKSKKTFGRLVFRATATTAKKVENFAFILSSTIGVMGEKDKYFCHRTHAHIYLISVEFISKLKYSFRNSNLDRKSYTVPRDVPSTYLGMYRPRDVPTQGCTDPGMYRPWDVPTQGCTDPGMYRPWDVPTQGCIDPGMYRPWDVPTQGCTYLKTAVADL